jgi:hypothetical protein
MKSEKFALEIKFRKILPATGRGERDALTIGAVAAELAQRFA